MFARLLTAAIAALSLLFVSPSANAQISDPGKIYLNYDMPTLVGFLSELDVPSRVSMAEDGMPIIFADVAPGKTIFMSPAACEGPGYTNCVGVFMFVFGTQQQLPYSTLLQNLEVLNGINEFLDYAKVYLSSDSNAPMLVRSLMGQHGYSKGSFVASLQLFAISADLLFNTLNEAKTNAQIFGDKSDAGKVEGLEPSIPALSSYAGIANLAPRTAEALLRSELPQQSTVLNNPSFKALLRTKDFLQENGYRVEAED